MAVIGHLDYLFLRAVTLSILQGNMVIMMHSLRDISLVFNLTKSALLSPGG